MRGNIERQKLSRHSPQLELQVKSFLIEKFKVFFLFFIELQKKKNRMKKKQAMQQSCI